MSPGGNVVWVLWLWLHDARGSSHYLHRCLSHCLNHCLCEASHIYNNLSSREEGGNMDSIISTVATNAHSLT